MMDIHRLSHISGEGCYNFANRRLAAIPSQSRSERDALPKIFISELEVFELEQEAQLVLENCIGLICPFS